MFFNGKKRKDILQWSTFNIAPYWTKIYYTVSWYTCILAHYSTAQQIPMPHWAEKFDQVHIQQIYNGLHFYQFTSYHANKLNYFWDVLLYVCLNNSYQLNYLMTILIKRHLKYSYNEERDWVLLTTQILLWHTC